MLKGWLTWEKTIKSSVHTKCQNANTCFSNLRKCLVCVSCLFFCHRLLACDYLGQTVTLVLGQRCKCGHPFTRHAGLGLFFVQGFLGHPKPSLSFSFRYITVVHWLLLILNTQCCNASMTWFMMNILQLVSDQFLGVCVLSMACGPSVTTWPSCIKVSQRSLHWFSIRSSCYWLCKGLIMGCLCFQVVIFLADNRLTSFRQPFSLSVGRWANTCRQSH